MNIFVVNGPTDCGKTTVSGLIDQLCGETQLVKFSDPVREVSQLLMGLDYDEYQESKDIKLGKYDTTMRKLLIAISDMVIDQLGDDYLGLEAADTALHELHYASDDGNKSNFFPPTETLVLDCGKQVEYDAFKATVHAKYPDQKIHLVNILRDGCTFEGDSREWVKDKDAIVLANNGTLDDLERDVTHLLQEIL